ncbi:MAG: hypothetical protein BWY45_00175 [Euryarchaeota archaeon ADurb.Bin294]|mgnify:CR=1 FL=1|jgi:hypothetical protein|nr:MAG: hypothetical protein BWY45_00175 [Euryarchaeota archaeon ADurb.Bin294]
MMIQKSDFLIFILLILFFSGYGAADAIITDDTMTHDDPAVSVSASDGPDYLVRFVDVPVYESTTYRGGVIHPSLGVKNTGMNDTSGDMVNVSGYLGSYLLLPVISTFPALMGGQEQTITLEYKLPDTIEYGGYVFSVMIDPDNLTHDTNTTNNMKKAGGMISITSPDDDSFIGCEACWEGYR